MLRLRVLRPANPKSSHIELAAANRDGAKKQKDLRKRPLANTAAMKFSVSTRAQKTMLAAKKKLR